MEKRSDVATRIGAALNGSVCESAPLPGGDLSMVVRFALTDGRRGVAKLGGNGAAEAEMLEALRGAGVVAPRVLAVDGDLLVIEEVPAGGRLGDAWDDLARVLVRLHGARGERYGWHRDYAFGRVTIGNDWSDDWPRFWAEHRLACHLPHLPPELSARVERLAGRIGEHLPRTPAPSLLHGDLWGGNVLVADGRVSGLIDPACYYGDREVDAAMLTLFDAPPVRFFEMLELEPGWCERQPVYRLWPLLVHVRLFGASYPGAAADALKRLGC